MPTPDPKRVPFRSEEYLAWHRTQKCHIYGHVLLFNPYGQLLEPVYGRYPAIISKAIACGAVGDRRGIEPSHVKAKRRFGDEWVIPQCPIHHEQFHQLGRETFDLIYGIDTELQAMKYWNLWHGDFAMFAEVG